MALEVIGAGLGRTGTLTLKTALETLGFGPCHHMIEVLADPNQIALWNRVADGGSPDWDEIYGSYRATVDWPGARFYAELADHYPKAKVVLSRRNPKRWYESMTETILAAMKQMAAVADASSDNPMRFGDILIAGKTFGHDFSEANVIAAFERHNAEVQSRIPPERLLVFEAADGWEPLCQFLEVPVPDEPFPRVNSRDEFWTHVEAGHEVTQQMRGGRPGESR
jgi:hypothetical protein